MAARIFSPFFLALFALFINCSYAQGPSPLEGATFHNSVEELRTASAAIPSTGNHAATVLLEETSFRYAADGSRRYFHRLIYRIDSQEGTETWNEASASWEPWYEQQPGIRARVLLPKGDFVELDPKTITDDPVNSEQDTYTSQRIRKAPLPGLAIGSIVEEEETVEDKHALSKSGSTQTFFLLRSVPIAFQKVVVEVPAGVPFQERVLNLPSLHADKQEKAGVVTYTYAATNLPASIGDDIDLATTTAPRPRVEFSTGSTWATVATEYLGMSDAAVKAGSSIASQLPAASADQMATIRSLVQFLHKEVRYTGIEFDEAQFVPGMPADTLKRHYGDCKDKAALLAAMLRLRGIPASLALLKTGPGPDINPAMPSLNRFDHAIVYVPAAGERKALWIDATASYNEVGTLPYMDAGRQALIIALETTSLTPIPDARPEDSVLIETREFFLPEFGKSRVVENSETHGSQDANYRSQFGGTISDNTRKDLEKYAYDAYLSKELKSIDHTDGTDLSHPFHLTLTMEQAGRAETSVVDMAVGVFPSSALNLLPGWFNTEDPPAETPEAKAQKQKMVAARASSYVFEPFVTERRYRIHLPDGFVLRTLPPDRNTAVGHGMLTEVFRSDSPELLTYTTRFDSGSGMLTTEEALAMRDAVIGIARRGSLLVTADEAGMKLLADGQFRSAIDTEYKAIAAHPDSALPHVHLASVLLKMGLADKAIKEAQTATKIAPNSYPAWSMLGYSLGHNDMAVRFGGGFHRNASIAAYGKAIALKADADGDRFDQAVMQEFDTRGIRYGDPISLKLAIASYQALIARVPENERNATYQDNLLIDLFLAREYEQLKAAAAKLPTSNTRRGMLIAAAASQNGTEAGLTEARRISTGGPDLTASLTNATQLLTRTGKYSEAVGLMEAIQKMVPEDQANAMARSIELFRHLKRVPQETPSGLAPQDPVQTVMIASITDTVSPAMAASISTRHAYLTDAIYQHNLQQSTEVHGILKRSAAGSGLAESVLADLILGNLKVTPTGDDKTGYIVVVESLGSKPQSFFVIQEDGRYRCVASDNDVQEVGAFTLYALEHNQLPLAVNLLNWKREHMQRGDADDALAGPLFPRFWKTDTAVADATPESIRLAALSLLTEIPAAAPLMPFVAKMRTGLASTTPHYEQRRTDLAVLLVRSYLTAGDSASALPLAEELLQAEPDSASGIELVTRAHILSGNTEPWVATLQKKLATKPTDQGLLHALVEAQSAQGDYKAARTTQQRLLDGGRATESDYNSYAWLGLFSNDLGDDTMKAARQSVSIGKNSSFATLHTLASIYAAQGHIAEAHQTLLQAMTAANIGEPNSSCWYVLGVIERQLGLNADAVSSFAKVDPRVTDYAADRSPTSTWLLADKELKTLRGKDTERSK